MRTSSGSSAFVEPLAQQSDLGLLGVLLAQFLLDGPHLLAQDVLALLFAHFGLRLAGDLAAQFQHLHFVREMRVDDPECIGPGFGVEQRVLQINVHAEHARDQVRHLERVGGFRNHPGELCRQFDVGTFQNAARSTSSRCNASSSGELSAGTGLAR